MKTKMKAVLVAVSLLLDSHSIFTGRLIAGLQGEAYFNQDGFITAF